jgi:DeoR family glycerol-3-phosphate regulon repressor
MPIREPIESPAPSSRQRAILALVREKRFAAVGQIALQFGVSEMTVRRDLRALEEFGLLERTHGGAVPGPDGAYADEPPYVMRQADNAEAKRRIARAAAALVGPNEAIGIDVGTTTQEMARQLVTARNLRVFTSSLRVAMALANSKVSVYTPGGEVRPQEMSLCGGITIEQLGRYRFDRVFIGASGLTPDGVFDFSIEDSEVKRQLIRQSAETILLADASKFGRVSVVSVAPLADFDVLVTDAMPDRPLAAALDRAGVRIIVAPAEGPA